MRIFTSPLSTRAFVAVPCRSNSQQQQPPHIAGGPATDTVLGASPVVVIERLPHAHEHHSSDFRRVADALEETLCRDHLLYDLWGAKDRCQLRIKGCQDTTTAGRAPNWHLAAKRNVDMLGKI